MRTNSKDQEPTIDEAIATLIDAKLIDLNVCMPATIVKYDKDTQFASVQPSLKRKWENGTLVNQPIIPNVPVVHPRARGGKAFIHMPVQIGDEVTLVFSHRSLDNWKTQGGVVDPADRRKFHLTDAYALVGGAAAPNAFTPETSDSIEIINGDSKVFIKPDGTIDMKNPLAEAQIMPDGTIDLMAQNAHTILHPDGTYNLYGGLEDDFVYVVVDHILGVQRAYTETAFGPEPLQDPEDPDWAIILERAEAFTNGIDPYGGV